MMNTRVAVVVGVLGAVLFGVAALALSSGGGKQKAAAGDESALPSGDSAGHTPSTKGKTPTATVTEAPYAPSANEGAVARATPQVPPDEQFLIANGGSEFFVPLHSWSGLGDRFGTDRGGGMMHGGLDFLLEGMHDVDVTASCSGTVTGTDQNATYGIYTAVDCGNGWITVYANLNQVAIHRGDRVTGGETLMGSAGPAYFHFEMRWLRIPVDPELYMSLSNVPQVSATASTRQSGEEPRTPTPTSSVTETSTPTPTKTPTRTATPASSGGGGGGGGDDGGGNAQPTPVPTDTPVPTNTPRPTRTPTPLPPDTPTPVPPTSTPTLTPTPEPPTPTRTATPRPVLQ